MSSTKPGVLHLNAKDNPSLANGRAGIPDPPRGPSPYAVTIGSEVFFDPHPGVQREVLQRLSARVMRGEGPSKYFLRGNRGGGKSVLMRKGFLHAMALIFPGLKYAVVRRNMPDLRQNHLIYLGAEMRKLGGQYHETHGIAHYSNGSMGFYRQCEEEADVEKIVGAEVAILFVDEAPQIKWEFLRTMSPSLRVAKLADGRQPYWILEVYGGNPIGDSIDELDRYFIDQDVAPHEDPEYDPREWRHINIGLQDNPSLDPLEYRKQFSGLPEHYRRAWLDGVRIESRTLFDVYKTISPELTTAHAGNPRYQPLPKESIGQPYHYIQELPTVGGVPLLKVPWIQIYRAFDMGYYPDPAICLWFAVMGSRVVVFHEETWFRTIAKDLAAKIVEITKELVGETPVGMTYIDPKCDVKTGSDVVTVRDMLELHGVPCEPSINDRILYADAIHGLLGEEVEPGVPKLQIYEPGCPMLAKYLPKMRWDETNPRKMADHKFDHWPIGVAYFAISSGVLSISAKEDRGAQEPVWMGWIREAQSRPTVKPRGYLR